MTRERGKKCQVERKLREQKSFSLRKKDVVESLVSRKERKAEELKKGRKVQRPFWPFSSSINSDLTAGVGKRNFNTTKFA